MKRILLSLGVFTLLVGSINLVSAQSLGDLAREQRAKKPARSPNARVYTNESLNLKPVSDAAPATSDAKGDAKDAKPVDAKASDAEKSDDKKLEDLQGKISQEKQEISQLQREIDVAQREAKLRAAQYYGDAGAKLRDEKNYMEAQRKAQADLGAKQQALSQAQQKLAGLEEDARKAGAPPSK